MSSEPLKFDYNIDRVFAAVGHAITRWELFESQLSYSYSIFIGAPRQIDVLQAYGKEGTIFTNRMETLAKAGEAYFRRSPSQSREGILSNLIAEARSLSIKRHHVAHGVVTAIAVMDPDRADADGFIWSNNMAFWVMPPWYSALNLTKYDGIHYRYSSADIDKIAAEFADATMRAVSFNELLAPER